MQRWTVLKLRTHFMRVHSKDASEKDQIERAPGDPFCETLGWVEYAEVTVQLMESPAIRDH